MRDLLFKNLTSGDRRRKVISTSEVIDKAGVRSIIRRHFICIVKEVKDEKIERTTPYLSVFKERNTKEHREKFFCRMKGSLVAVSHGKPYIIIFMHSLKINLEALKENNLLEGEKL